MQLIIGNKNYSSWSLRPWLLLRANDLRFDEIRIALDDSQTRELLSKYSPSGKVPVLHDGGLVIWDSLAICEYLSEKYLAGKGWPSDMNMRAEARSAAAEMHSGFAILRTQMPMNCRASGRRIASTPALLNDIQRIDQLWTQLLNNHTTKGPWLCGQFGIIDCMFAPVAFRFNTYGVSGSAKTNEYIRQFLQHPMMQQWLNEACAETEIIHQGEVGQ